jgi:hypothetical protein
MSNQVVRKRRFTTTQLSTLVLELGELVVDTVATTAVIGDGVTAGGVPLALKVHTHPNATTMTPGFMSTSDKTKLNALSESGGIQTIESNTVPLPAENTINFSTDFTLTDNPGASRTEFAISSTFINEMLSDTVALITALS